MRLMDRSGEMVVKNKKDKRSRYLLYLWDQMIRSMADDR